MSASTCTKRIANYIYVLAHIVESRCRSFYQVFRRVSFFAGLTCHFRDSKNRLIDRKIAISKPEEEDFAIGSSTLYFRHDDIKRAASADTPYAQCAVHLIPACTRTSNESSKIPQTGQNCASTCGLLWCDLRGRISSSNGIAARTHFTLNRSFRRKRPMSFIIVNRDCRLSGLHNYACL